MKDLYSGELFLRVVYVRIDARGGDLNGPVMVYGLDGVEVGNELGDDPWVCRCRYVLATVIDNVDSSKSQSMFVRSISLDLGDIDCSGQLRVVKAVAVDASQIQYHELHKMMVQDSWSPFSPPWETIGWVISMDPFAVGAGQVHDVPLVLWGIWSARGLASR